MAAGLKHARRLANSCAHSVDVVERHARHHQVACAIGKGQRHRVAHQGRKSTRSGRRFAHHRRGSVDRDHPVAQSTEVA